MLSMVSHKSSDCGMLESKTEYQELFELSLNNNFAVKVRRTEHNKKSRLIPHNRVLLSFS